MKRLLIRAGVSLVGMVAVLGWWTITGRHNDSTSVASRKMPAKILGGGGSQVTIEVDVNGPAEIGFMGSLPRKPGGEQTLEEHSERMTAGTHFWAVELGPHASGTFDLRALEPQVGNKLSWTVKVDGKEIARETDVLDKPLRSGEAQGLQAAIEDEQAEGSSI